MAAKRKGLVGFRVAADAIVPCAACGAVEGVPCKTVPRDKVPLKLGQVHFGRRVRRLLLTARARGKERERLEAEAVEMLREHLAEQRRRRRPKR